MCNLGVWLRILVLFDRNFIIFPRCVWQFKYVGHIFRNITENNRKLVEAYENNCPFIVFSFLVIADLLTEK